MNQEFTITTGWKIFYGLIGLVLIIFSIFLFSIPGNPNVEVNKAVYIIPLAVLSGGVLLLVSVFKRKVIISQNSIIYIGTWVKHEIALDEVKGCRVGDKVISIEPLNADDKKIAIGNYSDYADSDDLVNYLKENFKDLNAADLESSEKEFAEDQRFGITADERKTMLKKATIISNTYNIIGFVGGFALMLLKGNPFAIFCGIFYPIAGILIMAFSHSLIKFVSNKKTSVYPFIMIGFFVPLISLLFGSLFNYDILAYNQLLLPSFGVALVMFLPLYYFGINREAEKPKGQLIMMLVLSIIFGFGFIRTLNCQYDNSISHDFRTTVLSKYISSGKGAHYHITLNPWHDGQASKEIDVSHSTYNQTPVDATVIVHEKQGYLHIVWFYTDL